MLTVTENARKALRSILDNTETLPGQSLRLIEEQDNYALTIDTEQEGDQVIEQDGVAVLLVGADIQDQLDKIILDLQATPEGPRLAFVPKTPDQEPGAEVSE